MKALLLCLIFCFSCGGQIVEIADTSTPEPTDAQPDTYFVLPPYHPQDASIRLPNNPNQVPKLPPTHLNIVQ
jgi:hypothetical protein